MASHMRSGLLRHGATCLRQARPAPISRASRNATLQRLLSTLAVLEQRDGKLNMSSLASVSAAQKLGGSVHGFIAGSNIKPVADEAAKAAVHNPHAGTNPESGTGSEKGIRCGQANLHTWASSAFSALRQWQYKQYKQQKSSDRQGCLVNSEQSLRQYITIERRRVDMVIQSSRRA